MPSKYIVRNFTEGSCNHIYNKGVEKKEIFVDETDYRFFQTYLFIYLRPLEEVLAKYPDLPPRLLHKNLSKEVELMGYSLMSTHFRLLLKTKTKDGISKLMKQMSNVYTLYFNQKYNHVGSIFQGRFKAVTFPSKLLTPLLRFIHKEPSNYNSFNYYIKQAVNLPCSDEIREEVISQFPTLTRFVEYHQSQMGMARVADQIDPYVIESIQG